MNTVSRLTVLLVLVLSTHLLIAQENYEHRIVVLKELKEKVTSQEKEALKEEVTSINDREDRGEISPEKAKTLKEEAARKRALNIENRLAIIDNKIALLERNKGILLEENRNFNIFEDGIGLSILVNDEPWTIFEGRNRIPKYDRRTYSDFVVAIGLNNAIIEGESINDTPYKIGGSRFFEMGWAWRTRLFQNTNFMRLSYGFSFQFNGLKPKDNQYFVTDNGQTILEDFDVELDKSKLRMDNLVFPVYLEFGPSKFRKTDQLIRYSLDNQFRLGMGAYGGFNLGTRQKLKYTRDGDDVKDKLKRDYNTNDLIYGISGYAGFEGVLLYVKYDLNPIFRHAEVKQRNISLGLRFDM